MRKLFTSGLQLILVLLFNLIFHLHVQAQQLSNLKWIAGEVVTTTGDTVRGRITFYRDLGTVRVEALGNQERAFLPSQVEYFTGRNNGRNQYFITAYWERNKQEGGYKVLAFFELLAEGNMCLLKRTMHKSYSEKQVAEIVRDEITNIPKIILLNRLPGAVMPGLETADPYNFYFLLDLSDKLIPLPKPKEDLLLHLNDKYPELEVYIRKNKLSFKDERSLTKIINYYNQLKKVSKG